MSNARPERYGPDEDTEREILAKLPWTGNRQAAYCLDTKNPITKVRSEMRRVYETQMRDFDAHLMAQRSDRAMAAKAPPPTIKVDVQAERERADWQDRIEFEFKTGKYAPDKVGQVVNRGNLQFFGQPDHPGRR